eukprot:TRINITY_DN63057_c0_g1_i3.p1 TRINITY_DN63057_c0_g1~~TRINITY_DN63057_c0_g1_i3.p1  ORF type:complete len:180 (-),score=24.84 TRINITY_DN63057_c0_g1_i3:56-595(-)
MGGPSKCNGNIYSQFDNYHVRSWPVSFTTPDGYTWSSPEQCYQAQRFVPGSANWKAVRDTTSGTLQWQTGRKKKDRVNDGVDWDAKRVDIMYEANLAKYTQNEAVREVLLSTKGPIVPLDDGKGFWATWNGRILARIREELKPEGERDEEVLAALVKLFDQHREAEQQQLVVTLKTAKK